MLTPDRLRQHLHYDPVSGVFTWLVPLARNVRVGAEAGCLKADGYISIGIDGKQYKAHRLVWLYTYGVWPEQLDHRDRNRTNNRLLNLRLADNHLNGVNRNLFSNNKSGVKGVFWYSKLRKWQANITVRNVVHYLGRFDTLDAAISVRVQAESVFFAGMVDEEETVDG